MIWICSLYLLLIASPDVLILFNLKAYRYLDKQYFKRFSKKQNLHWLSDHNGRNPLVIKWGIYGMLLKQKKYNPNHRLFRNVSEEDYKFVHEAPLEIRNKILGEMVVRRFILFAIGVASVAFFIFLGGIDYLLEPITRENIDQRFKPL